MHDASQATTSAADTIRRQGGNWYERLARLGFAAKGVVYLLVGALAAAAAWGAGSARGSTGALQTLYDEPFGRVLLGLVALGLVGYVLWRLVSAFANPDDDGAGRRAFHFVTGVTHAVLAVAAARMALTGSGGSSGGNGSAAHWTAQVMAQPLGVFAVGLAGSGLALYGLHQIYRGFTADVDDRLALHRLRPSAVAWVVRLGRAGLIARGIVFALMGAFLIVAALQSDPSEARDLGGALRTLEGQTYGPWLLGAVAAGLFAYGVFQLIRAKYRRLRRPALP